MTKFIEAWNDGIQVFLNPEQVQRIGLAKSGALKQSQRNAKVVFADGSTGTYIVHRNVIKQLKACDCQAVEES